MSHVLEEPLISQLVLDKKAAGTASRNPHWRSKRGKNLFYSVFDHETSGSMKKIPKKQVNVSLLPTSFTVLLLVPGTVGCNCTCSQDPVVVTHYKSGYIIMYVQYLPLTSLNRECTLHATHN